MRYSPLQVGVIGYGYWGPNLLRNLQQAENVEVVAVCDMQPDRLAIARNVCPSAGLFSTEADDILNIKKYVGARQELQILLITPELMKEEIKAISEGIVESQEEV